MNTINWPRVVLGGLVVGIVFPLLTSLFDFLSVSLLGVGMQGEEVGFRSLEAIEKLGCCADLAGVSIFGIVSLGVFWVVFGIVEGIATMGVYAAIRPRFGPGLATAVYAGATFWFLNYALGGPLLGLTGVSTAIWGLFPAQGMILSAFIHLPAVCLAMMLGARLYREKGDSTAASTVHAVQAPSAYGRLEG